MIPTLFPLLPRCCWSNGDMIFARKGTKKLARLESTLQLLEAVATSLYLAWLSKGLTLSQTPAIYVLQGLPSGKKKTKHVKKLISWF
jgi:hypothetical protein